MRLTLFEIHTILDSSQRIFGKNTKVYLFGSRTDDTQKGGDIDLYIVPDDANEAQLKKVTFLTELNQKLGEQKIDVVIARDTDRPIEKEAIAKGIELNLEIIKLEKVLKECTKHLQRINEAHEDMSKFMLLTSAKYEHLSKHEVQAIDQYLYRFAKLQDTIGEKLFRLFLARYEENTDHLPFLDVIKKTEKIMGMEILNEWSDLRRIRNLLSHEYDDDPVEMSNLINLIYAKKHVLENIYLSLKKKASAQ